MVKLLLDGQQRITTLYGIVCGHPPKFFDANVQAFTGLYFNLEEQIFEFYAPMKMKGKPQWVNVTELMQKGAGEAIKELMTTPELQGNLAKHINQLSAIDGIKQVDLHIEEVTGEEKTVDVVVEIFNQVNSGGTKLSKGDLALAKVCAQWPEAREEMKARLNKWKNAGFYFRLEWFLRCINAIITGEALFEALKDVDTQSFRRGLQQADKSVDTILNMIAGRLGLDHDRVLGSRYSFPLIARYLVDHGGHISDAKERDKLLYWYVHTFLWGRYAGSTESVLNQDLALIKQTDGASDRLTDQLRRSRGDLRLRSEDFTGWSKGARFYPLLYMLTRAWHARDWDTGDELSNHLLGHMNRLELHHIFPKALLKKHGYSRAEVNAIANFTFLTKETNLLVSDRDPKEYMNEFATKNPGAVESHWVPTDPELWKVEKYREFLAARRELLAKAANKFLEGLLKGLVPETEVPISVLEQPNVGMPGGIESEGEEALIKECNEWVVRHGLAEGEFMYELSDTSTGEPLAILDLAWPNGLQEGLTQPVALLTDEDRETEEAANKAGFRFFRDPSTFKEYVQREIMGTEPEFRLS